jgi:hypothetical protein
MQWLKEKIPGDDFRFRLPQTLILATSNGLFDVLDWIADSCRDDFHPRDLWDAVHLSGRVDVLEWSLRKLGTPEECVLDEGIAIASREGNTSVLEWYKVNFRDYLENSGFIE